MHLCLGLIFIWITFHHTRIITAASLRNDYSDTSVRDIIKSHPDQKPHNSFVDQSNNYQPNDENLKFRPLLPYERRNRPIFTSKTYFGKNQMKELPRKYWENEGDETISSRIKSGRHRHLKYTPYRSPRIEFNQKRKIPKVQFEQQVKIRDQNAGHVYDAYGHNPGYVYKDTYGPNTRYASRDEYSENPRYASRDGYAVNPGYGSRDKYGENTRHGSREEYGTNTEHGSRDEYGANTEHGSRDEYGANTEHGSRDEYGANTEHGSRDDYGPIPEHSSRDEYGPNPEHVFREEYGSPVYYTKEYGHMYPGYANKEEYKGSSEENRNLVFDTNAAHASKQRHYANTGYGLQPGYVPNVYDSNLGYESNSKKYDIEDDFKKKFMEKRIEELRKDELKVDGKFFEDHSENNINGDRTKFINGDNEPLLPDSDFFSLGNGEETSNSDFNIDENLKKDELLKHSDEKFRKMPAEVNGNEPKAPKELIEQFEGSGEMENEFTALNILDREANKSGRVLDIFSRPNDSSQCTTPKNESGHCRGINECPLIGAMESFSLFLQYMCFQRGSIVGICCPDNPVIEVKEALEEKSQDKVKLQIQQPPDGCGLSTNTRIVGGTMSVPHEFSWMVALLRRNRFYCGGVIINNWYILTAAHCVLGIKISDLKVRLGEFDFHQRTDIQQDIPVTEIKRHALFVTSTFQHDIALLKLRRKIEYTKFIGSICLPNKMEDFSKKNATVAGWGTVSFGGAASPILRQVTVPVWDNKECDRAYRFERINESFMCAGASVSGEDACQGDSGGPLMSMNDDGRWEVIGIVSWGRRCGDPTYPGVYTRVTSYLDWIAENAQ